MKTITATITQMSLPKTEQIRKVVMFGFCVLGITVGLYVYFVGSIVFDVVARRSAEALVLKEGAQVAQLEATYFEKTKAFDLAYAKSLGFKESTSTLYAKRDVSRTVGMLTHGF